MIKPGVLLLITIQVCSLESTARVDLSGDGCACHCSTDTVMFHVWQPRNGPPERYIAKTIVNWYRRLETPGKGWAKTELMVLLGTSPQGIWTVETQIPDNSGEIQSKLVCTTIEGKRKTFPLIIELSQDSPSMLRSAILGRLKWLRRKGRWDAGSMLPVRLPLLSKAPALVLHETGKPSDDQYRWTLSVRTKDGRLARIDQQKRASFGWYYRDAKCFGGVQDEANGETWWIIVKTALSDTCGATWHPIRLTNQIPVSSTNSNSLARVAQTSARTERRR